MLLVEGETDEDLVNWLQRLGIVDVNVKLIEGGVEKLKLVSNEIITCHHDGHGISDARAVALLRVIWGWPQAWPRAALTDRIV